MIKYWLIVFVTGVICFVAGSVVTSYTYQKAFHIPLPSSPVEEPPIEVPPVKTEIQHPPRKCSIIQDPKGWNTVVCNQPITDGQVTELRSVPGVDTAFDVGRYRIVFQIERGFDAREVRASALKTVTEWGEKK